MADSKKRDIPVVVVDEEVDRKSVSDDAANLLQRHL